jgi:hypothetical protein
MLFVIIDVYIAIERNKIREAKVPEEVVWRMYNKYVKDKTIIENEKYFPKIIKDFKRDNNKSEAIIVDIDGTLAHANSGRNIYDETRVKEDSVDEDIKNLVNTLYNDYNVLLVSGRHASCRELTEEWLSNNDIRYNKLFMRQIGDNRKDFKIKREIFENFIKEKYSVIYVVDDRQQVVRMWRNLGLTVLQVNDVPF